MAGGSGEPKFVGVGEEELRSFVGVLEEIYKAKNCVRLERIREETPDGPVTRVAIGIYISPDVPTKH